MADFFNALREQRQFNDNRRQRVIDNKLADEQQSFDRATAERTQQEFDTERAQQVTLGALGAFSNMADSIANDTNLAEEDRPAAYAQAFDRIAPALQASGHDPQQIEGLRAQLLENPAQAADLLAGLQQGLTNSGSQPSLQAAFDQAGNAVFINPRTGRPAARGFAPATAVLGEGRLAVSQQNAATGAGALQQRQLTNDPNHVFDVSSARAEGRVAGETAARAPEALAAGQEVVRRIDTLLSTPPEQLSEVLGLPSLGGALRGGFGQYGAWPGSQAADIQSDIGSLSSSLRSAAYQLVLKGGGSITEAESAFGAEAFVNLQRSQSPGQFRDNLTNARQYFSGLLGRYQQQSAPSRNPSRQDNQRGAAPAAPAAPSFDVDAYLRERGM